MKKNTDTCSGITHTPALIEVTVLENGTVTNVVHNLENFADIHESFWYIEWMNLVETDPLSNFSHHPDVALNHFLLRPEISRFPMILLRIREGENMRAMAILTPKTYKYRGMFEYLPTITYQGYKLTGSRFLGHCSDQTTSKVLENIYLLMKQHAAEFLLAEDVDENNDICRMFLSERKERLKVFLPRAREPKHRIRFTEPRIDYWLKFSRRARQNHRRNFRKFENARIVRITEADQVPEFLNHAHQISLGSWQSKIYGVRVRNDEKTLEWLTFLANKGFLRCYLLFENEIPMAFEIGYQFKNYAHGVEAGYAQQYAEYSPGIILMHMEIEDLIAEDRIEIYDFGPGDAEYKRHFSNQTTLSGNLWLIPTGIRGTILIAYFTLNRFVEKTTHKIVDSIGLKAKVRAAYRRIGVFNVKN